MNVQKYIILISLGIRAIRILSTVQVIRVRETKIGKKLK